MRTERTKSGPRPRPPGPRPLPAARSRAVPGARRERQPDPALASERVERGAHDEGPGITQVAYEPGSIVDPSMVRARKHQDAAGTECDTLRVRVLLRRRCVDQDDVVLVFRQLQEARQRRAQQQLLWIGR